MSLIQNQPIRGAKAFGVCLALMAMAVAALAQTISTTTVQGTVYLANGSPGSGTLQLSWPAFTTASNQTVAAGKITTTINADGFLSVNLAPNLGSSPAGLFYTAIYHMSDGTTSTEYWVVPAAAQASIAQVRSQVMPAAQAVQAVSKAYVDQAIQSVARGNLTSTGGQLTGPLYLTGDPTQSLQAADKHYVDVSLAQAVPLSGAAVNGPLTAQQLGAAYQVDQFPGADFGAKLHACLSTISSVYGGTCDARNFSGNLAMAANLTISTANTTVMLPCATISTASQIIVAAGTRNVSLRGCALRGASNASGSQGGTVLLYAGSTAAIQVGDRTYAADTNGFHLDNVVINTTTATSAGAQTLVAYRTQEMDLESLYLLGNANQTGITLDGTGNYTGGTFYDNHISGFQTAINGIGHQVTNSAATDWLNASTFVRLHIDCPTANGNPIGGTYGVNLQQGDGNTFSGGDVENCGTAVHLGSNAQNNTIVGLRNENSTYQVVADAGSSYNSWMTGGTMFTGKLADNGTRNSFLDAFHRSFNSLNGDWYGSQQDATLTNHYRLGIGNGDERGLLDRYQTDYGYRWTMGLSDATGGEQFYQVLDELNNVYRLSIGQYNNGQSNTNNQTVINSAGMGAVVLNGSNNAGTGGVVFGSGGASESTVATVSNTGNAQFNGTMQVGGTTQSTGTVTVRNNADAEVDYYLWPGITTSQKGSFTYKDWNGSSQWYLVKDASNNWALNSATGGLDSFKAYQSTNSGDTYINASNASGVVRVNYETGAGSAFNIYGGNSSNLYASFSGSTSIKLPGLSASSGHNCLQIDASGYITNTGAACGSGSGSGTVNSGATGQIAYYNGNGAAVSGMSTIPVAAGGTGASTAAAALATLGGVSLAATTAQNLAGPINASVNSQINVMVYGTKGDCVTDDHNAIVAAQTAALAFSPPAALYFPKPPGHCYLTSTVQLAGVSWIGQPAGQGTLTGSPTANGVVIKGKPGQDVVAAPDPTTTSFTWNKSYSIRDITFQVDDSSAGSFPHRWPGRWFDDAGMTSGSAVLTSVSALPTCGDVGQAVQINGAGPGGANLITTIASVSPCWQGSSGWQPVVTLAAAASTAVSNARAYISLLGLPVSTTIGNCGIAFDDKDGLAANWANPSQIIGSLGVDFHNVNFVGSGKNNSCGLYTQGVWGFYQSKFENTNFQNNVFSVVQGCSEQNSAQQSCANDFQVWDHDWFFSDVYPWISYNGGFNRFESIQLTAQAGPQFLGLGNIWGDAAGEWRVYIPEFETFGTPTTYGTRITGVNQILTGTVIAGSPSMNSFFDATSSKCIGCSGLGNLQVSGAANDINFGQFTDGLTVTNVGRGNKITGQLSASPFKGIPVAYPYPLTPYKGDSQLVGRMTADAFHDGNGSTPYNNNDLIFWPQDFVFLNTGTPYSSYWASDSSSASGQSFTMPVSSGFGTFANIPFTPTQQQLTVGTNFPATAATIYLSLKCPVSVTSFTFSLLANGGAQTNLTGSCTTSYQGYSFITNSLSSYTGQNLAFGNRGANPFTVAWIIVRPFVNDVNGKTILGAGAAVLTGPATSTLHDCPWFTDTIGTIGDSGSGCGGGGGITGSGAGVSTSNGFIPMWTGTSSQGNSPLDWGHTNSNILTATVPNFMIVASTTGVALQMKSTLANSAGSGDLYLDEGNINARASVHNRISGTDFWVAGLNGNSNYSLTDSTNAHAIVNFPNNTMPTGSLGGNASGATAITQGASDNTTNIATDAFVHAQFGKSTLTVPTTTVAANSCNTGTAVTITGITSTSSLQLPTPNADPTAITGFSTSGTALYFVIWPTANTYNWKICNNSASSITPGASTTWNVGAIF